VIERDDLVRFLGIQPGCQLDVLEGFFAEGPEAVEGAFTALEQEGLARRTARGMCLLTEEGRTLRDASIARDISAFASSPVAEAYETFEPVNLAFLGWATTWQLREGGEDDQTLLARLWEIDAEVQPLLGEVSRKIGRFGYHQSALSGALKQVEAGEMDWLLSPVKASYHTAWFRMHQDWLETLGKERE
jgi:hypothetical protein